MKKNILFLCSENSCHSQMAEGILRHFSGKNYNIYSAGINPKEIDKNTIKIMKEIGIDISKQKSKSIKKFKDKNFDIIVTIYDTKDINYPSLWEQAKKLSWEFINPTEGLQYQQYLPEALRELRDKIKEKIQNYFVK
jgi:arsenate reductase